MDDAVGAAEQKIDMRANRVGIVIESKFGIFQVELVGLVVKIIEVASLPVGGVARTVGVVAVITIYVTAKVNRPNTPGWSCRCRRWSRGRAGVRGGWSWGTRGLRSRDKG